MYFLSEGQDNFCRVKKITRQLKKYMFNYLFDVDRLEYEIWNGVGHKEVYNFFVKHFVVVLECVSFVSLSARIWKMLVLELFKSLNMWNY